MKSGLSIPFVRWWVFWSIAAVTMITALMSGLGAFITKSDCTYLSWSTIGVFFLASAHFGFRVQKEGTAVDTQVMKYATDLCTSLGFLGTIVGLVLMVTGAFSSIRVQDTESIQNSIVAMASGIGTALVTTLVGLICSILMEFQVALVTMRWGGK